MKRFLISVVAVATVATVPLAAQAAPWQSVNQRQANIDRRIDQGIRAGKITRPEAARLKGQFKDLARLEAQYRRSGGGLSARERADLDSRFDRLSRSVQYEKNDGDHRRG